MHQHHSPKPNYSLETLRVAIDVQDEAILAALTGRQRLVDRIRAVKTAEGHLVYRPGREAQILRRLFDTADPSLDRHLINQIWREIFSSAIMLQETLTVAVGTGSGFFLRELARRDFGHAVTLETVSLDEAVEKLLSHALHVIVLPNTPEGVACVLKAIAADDSVHIMGMMPFLSDGSAPRAYTIGRVCPEESGDDVTLYRDGDEIKTKDGFHLDVPGWLGIVPRPYVLS